MTTRPVLDLGINVAQLVSIVGGFIYLGVELGRRDNAISNTGARVDELAAIVQDLTRAQIVAAANDATHQRDLDALRVRLDRLETRKVVP